MPYAARKNPRQHIRRRAVIHPKRRAHAPRIIEGQRRGNSGHHIAPSNRQQVLGTAIFPFRKHIRAGRDHKPSRAESTESGHTFLLLFYYKKSTLNTPVHTPPAPSPIASAKRRILRQNQTKTGAKVACYGRFLAKVTL
jgi:hypothetical protein